ncbi:MAG: hypothetical protein APG12_01330 [Candidatus Methanofastidiosum methylothiophilum]|uniref:Uncharacterized protein n=1 Tax=Candidatus Methanofastidiosum methylothiophilum TaxID=1705564 RepID=A0A150IXH7_9EURY|nr:MAG: hypothetical protein APG10_01781 [Candidatus Methanofastidiosum methylthiophilus]KYC48490.1 MAG: hypothetical protein APG11_00297 [Candidatus Methanofastidiosum methylthiophilus]KYC49683.1 MAG: hypothetical protein APG12_01330 [Candidatus Methanofastidiosum methylthiophilus]
MKNISTNGERMTGTSSMEHLISKEEIELLSKTKELIEELLDTLEVLADDDTLEAIKQSATDFEKGKFESFSAKKEIEDFIDSL